MAGDLGGGRKHAYGEIGYYIWKDFRTTMKRQLKMLQTKFDGLKNTTGVSCLSESEDSLLMCRRNRICC